MAVTNVNLTTASIDVDKFNGTLSAKESGALSAYNSDMKKLIRKVKKLSDYNDETYYIMLVERSDDQTLGGFMPVNSNFGFVFAKANSGKEQLNRTIAHELAHGAFRLWHTFSSENIYVAQQGSTQNLMDYNGTNSELYKYQWDYIHNPQQGIVRWMVDDEESAVIKNEKVTGVWKTVNPPRMYDAKPKLTYNKIFIPDDEYIRRTHTLIQLVDGSKFLVSPLETSEVGYTYQIQLPEIDEWSTVYLDWFESDCLSCELEFIGNELTKKAGKVSKVVSRYVLPIEDIYILIEGENFDGEEASRVAAGGFILLEAVQVGKVYKLVKGFKAVGRGVAATSQLRNKALKMTIKDISKETALDMSAQFVVNLMKLSIEHQEYTDDDLLIAAMEQIDVKASVLTGSISAMSFVNREEAVMSCALEFFKSIENSKSIDAKALKDGAKSCLIEAGITMAFKYGAKTKFMQGFFNQLDDEAKQHILLSRFKNFTGENCYKVFESYLKKILIPSDYEK